MTLLDGEEYMELLEARQQVWLEARADKPIQLRFGPLVEWFIEPGDEDLVDMASLEPSPQPKRERKPRTYRSAESLRAERDRVQAQRDAIDGSDSDDMAIVNISPNSRNRAVARAGRRRFAKLDRDLARYTG